MSQSVDFLSNCRENKCEQMLFLFGPFTRFFVIHIPFSSFATLTKLSSNVNIVSTHLVKNITDIVIVSSFTFGMKIKWLHFKHFLTAKGKMLKTSIQYLLTDTSSPLLFLRHSLWQSVKDIHMYITKHWDNIALLIKFITMCISFTEGGYLRWSVQDGVEQGVCVCVCLIDTTFVKEHVQGVTNI